MDVTIFVQCSNCKFSFPTENDDFECRRFPPQNREYPIVYCDEWCGEYVENPITAEIIRKDYAAQQGVQLTAAGVESDGENQDSGGN